MQVFRPKQRLTTQGLTVFTDMKARAKIRSHVDLEPDDSVDRQLSNCFRFTAMTA